MSSSSYPSFFLTLYTLGAFWWAVYRAPKLLRQYPERETRYGNIGFWLCGGFMILSVIASHLEQRVHPEWHRHPVWYAYWVAWVDIAFALVFFTLPWWRQRLARWWDKHLPSRSAHRTPTT